MASNTHVTFVGNIGNKPELDTSGKTSRLRVVLYLDQYQGEDSKTKDKEEILEFTVFGKAAENLSESLTQGMNVGVIGRFGSYQFDYVDDNGEDRYKHIPSFIANFVAPNPSFYTFEVENTSKKGGSAKRSTRRRSTRQEEPEETSEEDAPEEEAQEESKPAARRKSASKSSAKSKPAASSGSSDDWDF